MISYTTLVKQIERHVTAAQQASTEQQLREQLTAVRALCDVVLTGDQTVQPMERVMVRDITEEPVFVAAQPVQTVPSQKLQESDANGDSIFDF
ncbi:YwdI family protein [Solibacillus sp. FSL H8-0538]|uniref:YwdI family protein n=1 Tax=Solibacillus sp. FSL H8-0538 TaxID=2921400 RepID=UPI0030FAD14B